MSVCPRLACLRDSTSPYFRSITHVSGGRCSVLLWRHCSALCTSGFVCYVSFAYNGKVGAGIHLTKGCLLKVTHQGSTDSIHWVQYKLRATVHRSLQHKAPYCTTDCCIHTSDMARRQHLRSAGCHQLFVPRHRRSMFGRRAYTAH